MAAAGHRPFLVEAYRETEFPDTASLTGIVVLGGEMGVHDSARFPHLDRVRSLMEQALENGVALLGICLGGQLLAQVAGGTVASPSPHGEKGISRVTLTPAGSLDPLFAGVERTFTTFQLHNDSFLPPPSAQLLAFSAACPAQAFRLGNNAYGVQFHPEVDHAIVSRWDSLSSGAEDFSAQLSRSRTPFDLSSRTIIGNFISLAAASRPC